MAYSHHLSISSVECKLLKEIAEEEGFVDYEMTESCFTTNGDNYLSTIKGISITGKVKGEKSRLSLVLKSALKGDAVRVETPIANLFLREIFVYDTVLPAFFKFQADKKLPSDFGFAKCYKTCALEKQELLILDDMRTRGYTMCDRRQPVEGEHLKLVLREYGRFHAMSFAIRDQQPETFKSLVGDMYDIFDLYMKQANFATVMQDSCRRAAGSLLSEIDKNASIKFNNFVEETMIGFLHSLPNLVDDYSAILHGDSWINNMLFKFEDKDDPGKPTEMCILDLQISRLNSPVLDLSYFIYSCCSKVVLDNLNEYLNVYYDSLSDHLIKLGSSAEKVYPNSVFQDQWKRLARFGLILACLLIYVILAEKEEAPNHVKNANSGKTTEEMFKFHIKNIELFNSRIRDVIIHFVENEFI